MGKVRHHGGLLPSREIGIWVGDGGLHRISELKSGGLFPSLRKRRRDNEMMLVKGLIRRIRVF